MEPGHIGVVITKLCDSNSLKDKYTLSPLSGQSG